MNVFCRFAIVSGALYFPPMTSTAALLSYDGFEYAPAGSDLLGNIGGFGFSTAWRPGGFNASNHAIYDVPSGSLTFGSLLTSGNRVQTGSVDEIAGLTRDFSVALGAPGTTRYLSFLLRPEGTLQGGAFNGFFGVVLEQPLEPELFIGKPGGAAIDRYVLEDRGGGQQVASTVAAMVDETVLLVLKAEFAAGNDRFTLYVNPVPGAPEPGSGIMQNRSDAGSVAGVTVYSTGAFSIDEFRVGETFEDVTPVPEQDSALLLILGAAVASRQGRRVPSKCHQFVSRDLRHQSTI